MYHTQYTHNHIHTLVFNEVHPVWLFAQVLFQMPTDLETPSAFTTVFSDKANGTDKRGISVRF